MKKSTPSTSLATDLRDHGVPVRNGWCRAYKVWRNPLTGRESIYCGIFTNPALVVELDVATGRCRTFRMPADCYWPWGIEVTSEGHVLAASSTGKLCRLNPQTGKIWVTGNLGSWTWNIVPGGDDQFYLRTREDRLFHYDAKTETLKDLGPRDKAALKINFAVPQQKLSDGRPVAYVDSEIFRIGTGKKARCLPLQYKTDGTSIYHLAEGPNQTVYGSTIMPLFLFRYTPATRKLENLGRGAPDNGEAYSYGHCDGKLYYGCYSLANLMSYDPAKPLHRDPPGAMKWKKNPRLVTHLGPGHLRPRAMCIDSKKRIWIGGLPHPGTRHGAMGCYDIVRKKYVNNPVVVREQSVWTLAADASGDVVYGGTTAVATVSPAVKTDAHLFAWDARRQKLLWKRQPIANVTEYNNLVFHQGKLYGTTGTPFSMFCFDPVKQAMEYIIPSPVGGAREQSICLGPDGNIYGITWMTLFRWSPRTGKIEELYRCVGDEAQVRPGGSLFHRGAVIIKDRYYFSCGAHVMSLRLPPAKQ